MLHHRRKHCETNCPGAAAATGSQKAREWNPSNPRNSTSIKQNGVTLRKQWTPELDARTKQRLGTETLPIDDTKSTLAAQHHSPTHHRNDAFRSFAVDAAISLTLCLAGSWCRLIRSLGWNRNRKKSQRDSLFHHLGAHRGALSLSSPEKWIISSMFIPYWIPYFKAFPCHDMMIPSARSTSNQWLYLMASLGCWQESTPSSSQDQCIAWGCPKTVRNDPLGWLLTE